MRRLRLSRGLPVTGERSALPAMRSSRASATPCRTSTARAIWARFEGLSFQVGVHFEKSTPGLPEVLAALS